MLLSFSDVLTPRINALLLPYRVELVKVSGNWRGFNPVVRAGYVRFAAGEMRDVEVELDFFRSLVNDDLVFAHAYVAGGQIGFVHTPEGWDLKGAQDQPLNIDFAGLAKNTRSADAGMHLIFQRGGAAAGYDVVLKFDNNNQNPRVAASIASPNTGPEPQVLSLSVSRYVANGSTDDGQQKPYAQLNAQGDLLIEPGLLGAAGLAVSVSEGSWFERETRDAQTVGTGRLLAEISVLESPLVKVGTTPKLIASVDVQRLGQRLFGRLHSNLAAGDLASLSLPEMSFLVNADEVVSALGNSATLGGIFTTDQLLAMGVVENIVLGPITKFAKDVLVPETILGEWFAGLNVRGHVKTLTAYYDEQLGFGFSAQAKDLKLSAYRGSPSFSNTDADIFGDLQHIGMSVSGQNVTMEFPTVFAEPWFFEQVQGQLMLLFRPGYASVRGHDIQAYSGISRINGGFATSRPSSREEQRLSLGLAVDRSLPRKLGPMYRSSSAKGYAVGCSKRRKPVSLWIPP
jgi:hypothetical protein